MLESDTLLKAPQDITSFQTVCGICNGMCGIKVDVVNGCVAGIKGKEYTAFGRGYSCPKGRAMVELINAPDRLKTPLRKTTDGGWQPVSWDDALEFTASRLEKTKSRYGPESVAVHVGQAGVRKEFTQYASRFCNAFGTPNFSTAGSHCHMSKMMANVLTCGVLPVSDFENSRCIVLWGSNPARSCPPLMLNINKARERGARLIVIDPHLGSTAEKSDLYLRVKPGTDGALALGMLNIIISEKLYDKEFVARFTVGFDELASLVKKYSPEEVERITWIPAAKVIEAARLYAGSGPSCISAGIALELQPNGFQTHRAIAVLQAVTGNLDVAGGALVVPPASLSSLKIENDCKKPAIGQKEFPLFHRQTGNAQANIYAGAVLEGKPYPLKGMIIAGSNPVLTWPNAGQVKKALGSLDFLVVMDHFMTETAMLADLVLPAATFLERNDLWHGSPVYGIPAIGVIPKVMNSGNCMSDWLFWKKLGERVGFGDIFPWENEIEAMNDRLKPLGVTYDDLLRKPVGHNYGQRTYRKYEKSGFKTRSGKIEIYSEVLKEYGYDPVPTYTDPYGSQESAREAAEKYPLVLTTGARSLEYMHSRFHNLPSLKKKSPEPFVEVHRDTAEILGLVDGETVIVESAVGGVRIKTKLSERTDPWVIFMPHGWDEANANILTENDRLDPVSGFPPDRCLMARIRKIKE